MARPAGMPQPDRSPAFEPLEPRLLLSGSVLISEFMALNGDTLLDEDNESSDWVEILNPGTSAVNLNNWRLVDSADEWVFPSVTLAGGKRLVVFASNKDRRDPEGELHTNFRLSGDGEYLALLDPSGRVVHEYGDPLLAEGYPPQRQDMSYGVLYQEHDVRTLVEKGDPVRYLVPAGDGLGRSWVATDFDDRAWPNGTTGLGFGLGGGSGTQTLIPRGSVWRYLDDGSNQGTRWRGPSFYDNSWQAGDAQLGYGDGDEETVVGHGSSSSNKYITTYFRHHFTVDNAWQYAGLTLRVMRDDGAVIYLNGQELRRSNMTSGTITYRTLADSTVGGAEEDAYFEYFEDAGHLLVDGDNVLAVEIHQRSGGSTDISFDLELIAEVSTAGLIETDLQDEMLGTNATAYVRIPFTVADPHEISQLLLGMAYEDGYVAYLNGVEVARRNAPADPQWSSAALSDRPVQEALLTETVDVSDYVDVLEAGENVLAIHALNDDASDGAFVVLPALTALAGVTVTENYFVTPTPWDANVPGVLGVVADTKFSVDRGFYDESFDVEITTDTDGAQIRYTVDGTEPTATHGEVYDPAHPIHIEHTTILRAAAFQPGWIPTNVDTQTYVFLADVLSQPADPTGWPAQWVGLSEQTTADYEMDPEIVSSYLGTLKDDLLSLPTMSIVTDPEHLFDTNTGIYSNPTREGVGWERPASLELIHPDGTEGFQVNAGLRIYGGVGRRAEFRKHTFRFLFKGVYGPTKLRYPVFGEDAADEFDTIVLRSGFNDAWVWGGSRTQYILDEYARRLQLALGGVAGHGTFVHLYVNGLYWGLYNPCERPEASFSASYFGGDKDDWDALNSGQAVDGNGDAWNALRNLNSQGYETMAKYQRLQGNNPDGTNNPNYQDYLDLEAYIDYLIMNFYTGNRDWPGHNWYGSRLRGPDSTGWKFYSWDAEWIVGLNSGLYEDRTGLSNSLCEAYSRLRSNAEFRMLFADRVHQAFFSGGPLYVSSALPNWDPAHPWRNRPAALYADLADQVERAIRCESARWGDVRSTNPYTPQHWYNQRNWVLDTYMPDRSRVVLDQLEAAGLYPDVVAPSFYVNHSAQHGGPVGPGDELWISAPAGTVYYTTDGTDPRLLGGAVSPTANVYEGTIDFPYSRRVKARAYHNGTWSALNEATFYVETFPPLRITEVMYNPAEPGLVERLAGHLDNDDFEYVEIQNTASYTVNLLNVRLTDGVGFTFPEMLLGPNEYVVLVKDREAFDERYGIAAHGITVAGQYTGSLANGGERIEMVSAVGEVVHDFEYNDNWYDHTDGEGFSLTILDATAPLADWAGDEGWRGSGFLHGSPGAEDFGCAAGAIVISEVLAHSNEAPNDWIELHNTTGEPIDVGGWFLSDSGDDLRKYEIPDDTVILDGRRVVFTEDENFGHDAPDPGRRAGFALSELGDDVYLSSGIDGRVSGYREHVDFGASPPELSYGLHADSLGEADFTLLSAATLAGDNAAPYVGRLVINELMYHPTDPTPEERAAGFAGDEDFEFIELYNRSGAAVDLTKHYLSGGVGFTFGWYDTDALDTAAWTLEKGAAATWTADLPQADPYSVWIYLENDDRNGGSWELDSSASYEVSQAGEKTTVVVDQNFAAGRWLLLGSFAFEAGPATVTLTRGTGDPDERTLADRVRFLGASPEVLVDNAAPGFEAHGSGLSVLAPGERVVLVSNLGAFDERYGVEANAIAVAGEYTGSLDNGGERVRLRRADTPEVTGHIPYVRIDHVRYNDLEPWPLEPDGGGSSLNRLLPADYGNDVANWGASSRGGSPGGVNLARDTTPPLAPQDLTAEAITISRIDLSWDAAVEPETFVDHYILYRDGEELTRTSETAWIDTGLLQTQQYNYEVSAVNNDGFEGARSQPVVAKPRLGLVSAHSVDPSRVVVTFTSAVDPATGPDPANYTILDFCGRPIGIAGAYVQPGTTQVVLTVSTPLVATVNHRLSVENVRDATGSLIQDDSETPFAYREVDPDLVAWWPLDEAAGVDGFDATGNLRHLEIRGASWETGIQGGALRFDGVDDFAVDADGGAYLNDLAQVTVAMWIRADATGTDNGFFTTGPSGNSNCLSARHDYFGWSGWKTNTFKVFLSASTGNTSIEGPAQTQTTDWQHVAVTWRGGQPLKLYLDGLFQSPSHPGKADLGGRLDDATQVLLGRGERGASCAWAGLIDDVRIYDRQLSGAEIAALANRVPVAGDDTYDVPVDEAFQADAAGGVLANDVDPDAGPQPMAASLICGASHGSLALHRDGSFEYAPAAGYAGADGFTYQVSDGLGCSRATAVTLRVGGEAPAVVGFGRNGGTDRPSELTSVAVRFSQNVSASLDVADLSIHNDSTGADVDLAAATLLYDEQSDTARWDLAGAAIEPGWHTVSLRAEGVTSPSGRPLGGEGAEDYHTALLVAAPGDTNLDGEIGRADFLTLRAHFGQAGADWDAGDADYSGAVDFRDYLALKRHVGTVLDSAPSAPLGDEAEQASAAGAAPTGAVPLEAGEPTEAHELTAAAPTPARPATEARDGDHAPPVVLPAPEAPSADALLPAPRTDGPVDALAETWQPPETERHEPATRMQPLPPDLLDVLTAHRLEAPLGT